MHDIIFFVKTPNTLYIFTIPHSKIPSPKKTADRKAVFFICIIKKADADKSASALLKLRFNLNTYIYILSFRKRCKIIIIRRVTHPPGDTIER